MTIIPSLPTWLFSRRALARISMIVRLGLSSIQIGAWPRRPIALEMFDQSSPLSCPLRRRCESTLASEQSSRCVSSRWLISSEKKRHGFGFGRVERGVGEHARGANDVLPMAGRAPTTTSELGCSPERRRSRSR